MLLLRSVHVVYIFLHGYLCRVVLTSGRVETGRTFVFIFFASRSVFSPVSSSPFTARFHSTSSRLIGESLRAFLQVYMKKVERVMCVDFSVHRQTTDFGRRKEKRAPLHLFSSKRERETPHLSAVPGRYDRALAWDNCMRGLCVSSCLQEGLYYQLVQSQIMSHEAEAKVKGEEPPFVYENDLTGDSIREQISRRLSILSSKRSRSSSLVLPAGSSQAVALQQEQHQPLNESLLAASSAAEGGSKTVHGSLLFLSFSVSFRKMYRGARLRLHS